MSAKKNKPSRRNFLKGVAFGATAVSGANLVNKEVVQAQDAATTSEQIADVSSQFDFTQQSGALQPDKIVDSACQFCNSLCGLKVHLKNDRVIDILGEPDDPVQAGELCVKAPMMSELVYNRFRLQSPLKRVKGEKGANDSQFEPIDWDEALETIAAKFLALRDAGEARAIANKTMGRLPRGTGSLVGRYFELLGSPNNTRTLAKVFYDLIKSLLFLLNNHEILASS